MKINLLTFGFIAASAMMTACSSDEPVEKNDTPDTPSVSTSEAAYMTVRLLDANQNSRAATDGTYENGSEDEYSVTSATFLFFDADGVYVGKATPWNGGSEDKENENIEFKSNSVIVLDNLTDKGYPSYIMTILNAPKDFVAESTMAATAKKLVNYKTKSDGNDYFVMSTTSYFDDEAPNRHDDNYYYATKVTADDFFTSAEQAEKDFNKYVPIYVERLAAKAQVTSDATSGNGLYKVETTVVGADYDNANEKDSNVGKTDLYVKFDGWALSNTVNDSYISKNLDGWNKSSELFDDWNNSNYFRSYWGKSTVYSEDKDNFDESRLTRHSWKELSKTVGSDVDYCNENTTKEYGSAPSQATSVLIAATVCDKDGNGLDLVRYKGLLFNKADFIKYTLNVVNSNNALNYWYVSNKEEVKDEEGNAKKDNDGNIVYNIEYTQIGVNQLNIDWHKFDVTDGSVDLDKAIVVVTGFNQTEGEDPIELYKKEGENYTKITASEESNNVLTEVTENINEAIKEYIGAVEAFNGGKMYYAVPIEHLNTTEGEEGYYGVVRNHWYKITVNSIAKIGHGVFTPDEIIIPDDDDNKLYYIGATINVLSWKTVNQGVDL